MKRLHTYGQHFLRRPSLVKELLGRSTIKPSETVIDIGAGSGVITSVLAQTVKRVIAVEVEAKAADILQQNMAKYPNVTIYRGDFLSMPLPAGEYSIFANIPFNLSSPIIHRLIETDQPPRAAYLIVQKQFGRKLVATDTTHFTSQLGMVLGARYDVKVRKKLERTDFWPHPAVDTVFIEILRRQTPLIPAGHLKAYQKFTEECFSDPKKLTKMPLEAVGIPPKASPSRLHLEQWVALFKAQTHYR